MFNILSVAFSQTKLFEKMPLRWSQQDMKTYQLIVARKCDDKFLRGKFDFISKQSWPSTIRKTEIMTKRDRTYF